MMNPDDIENRFAYHKPNAEKVISHESIRDLCKELAHELNNHVPDGREKSLAITHLEDVMMWANAGIARNDS